MIRQLEQFQLAVLAFYSFDVAVAAGWDTAISPCVASPKGRMGFHIANLEQLGNGRHLSVLRPELPLVAPIEDGSMEFLGVEYVIPAPDWPHEEPPRFLGQVLYYNPEPDIWALHVWVRNSIRMGSSPLESGGELRVCRLRPSPGGFPPIRPDTAGPVSRREGRAWPRPAF